MNSSRCRERMPMLAPARANRSPAPEAGLNREFCSSLRFRFAMSLIVVIVSIATNIAPVLGAVPYDESIELPSSARFAPTIDDYCIVDPCDEASPILPTLIPIPGSQTVLSGPLGGRQYLGGDWMGYRSTWADNGVTADISTTQYYQGIAAGGLQQGFRYGGRNDYFVDIDGDKCGLWQGLLVSLHGETRYGQTIDRMTGAFMPTNLMLDVPQNYGSVTALTAFKVTQYLSDDMLVYGGRLNMFDTFSQPITGATALNGFINTAMMFNPVYGRTVPYSTYGAGFVYLQDKHPLFSISILNTANTPTVSGFDSFFTNGATIFSALNLPTRFLDLPGHQGVAGTYCTGTFSDLQPTAYYDLNLGPGFKVAPSTGSWCFAYSFDQALYASPQDPKRIWGVFGNFGVSDGNPNPAQRFLNLGVSGTSLIEQRPQDSFGIGYYYLNVTTVLKDISPPALGLKNEQGLELYYNVAVTPWFHLTPDVQLIDPFKQFADSSFVLGMRGKIDF